MQLVIKHNNTIYKIDSKYSSDISIPYNFNGPQPNFYDVNPGQLHPLEIDNLIYSVSSGASCNVPEISLNIHCTGTHTEHVGHLLNNPGSVSEKLDDIIMPAGLISVRAIPFIHCNDTYHVEVDENEMVICKKFLSSEFDKVMKYDISSLIIRTLPNNRSKKYLTYSENIPPFFTNDAISFLIEKKIKHVIVDVPSLDRINDKGILGNHRIFWSSSSNTINELNENSTSTITELAFIPNNVLDGFYFLSIQLPHFRCDAAPSRPIIVKPS